MSLQSQLFLLIVLTLLECFFSINSFSIPTNKKYTLTSCNPLTTSLPYYEEFQKEVVKSSIMPTGEVELCSPYVLWRDDLLTNPDNFQIPLEIFSVKGVLDITLYVRKVRIETHFFSYETRAFCYSDKCSVPGPTLHLTLGDRLRVKIVNELDPEDDLEQTGSVSDAGSDLLLQQRVYTNRVNIFFPTLPFDVEDNSIFHTVLPGESHQYEYVIPNSDHIQPGLHLYHSNVEGVSSLHFLGGLFGAVKLYPTLNDNFAYPSSFRLIPSMPFVFSHLLVDKPDAVIEESANKKYSNLDFDLKEDENMYNLEDFSEKWRKSSLSLSFLSSFFQSKIKPNTIYNREKHAELGLDIDNPTERVNDIWLVNGQYQPKVDFYMNTWFFFDFYVASADRILELEIKNVVGMDSIYADKLTREATYTAAELEGEEAEETIEVVRCQMRLVSKNGVYYTTSQEGTYVDHLILYQGERASVAVRCVQPGVYYLQSVANFKNVLDPSVRSTQFENVGDYQTKSTQVLATFHATQTSIAQETLQRDLSFIRRPIWMNSTSESERIEDELFKFEEKELTVTKYQSELNTFNKISITTAFQKDFEELYPICDKKFQEKFENLPSIGGLKYGMGTNCKLPCYDSILCQSLFGTSAYNATRFPSALKGSCYFGSSLIDGISTVRDDCDILTTTEEEEDKELFPDIYKVPLSPIELQSDTIIPSFISLSLYGHDDFLYPIYIQNHQLKLKKYSSVDSSISNIIKKDHYEPLYQLPYPLDSDLATPRWNDMFIPVQGLLEFKLKLISSNISDIFSEDFDNIEKFQKFPVLTTFLKFQDIGFLRMFDYTKRSSEILDPNDIEPEYDPNLLDEYVTVDTIISDGNEDNMPDLSDLSTPLEFLNSDMAKIGKQCNLTGENYFYNEHIDLKTKARYISTTSCPNHFSKCQSSECGESEKTRALIQNDMYSIPLYPTLRNSKELNSFIDLTCSSDRNKRENVNQILGGIALNGVGIYSTGNANFKQNCIEYKYKDSYLSLRKEELKKVSEYKRLNSARVVSASLSPDEIQQIESDIKRKYELLEFSFAAKGRTTCNVTYHFYEGLLECGNEFERVANDIDVCGGMAHRKSGRYAYHTLPVCLYKLLERDRNSKLKADSLEHNKVLRYPPHSVQIGWALDGFPIYGPRSIRGIRMYPCGHFLAHSTLCLDSCGGYEGKLPDVDDYLYRYYISWESNRENSNYLSHNDYDKDLPLDSCSSTIDGYGDCSRNSNKCCISDLPSKNIFPYTLGCLRGCKLGEKNCHGNIEKKGYVPSFFPKVSHNLHELYMINPPHSDSNIITPSPIPVPITPIIPTPDSPFELIEKNLKNKVKILTRISNVTYNTYQDVEKLKTRPIQLSLSDSYHYSLEISKDSIINSKLIQKNKNSDDKEYYYSYYDILQKYRLGYTTASLNREKLVPEITSSFKSFSSNMKNEAYLTSITQNSKENLIYFSSEFEIFSYNLQSNVQESLINSIIKVDLLGYNFGKSRDDINLILVNSFKCHSINFLSDQKLSCWITSTSNLNVLQLKSSQVEVYTKNGLIKGISLDAQSVFIEKTNKPVLRAVEFTVKPFRPTSLFYVPGTDEQTVYSSPNLSNPNQEEFENISNSEIHRQHSTKGTLYFSNQVEGSFSLHRMTSDGSFFETIFEGLQKITSIQVFKTIFNEDLSFRHLDASLSDQPECVKYASLKREIPSLYSQINSPICASEGHYIVLSDYFLESTIGFPLWPIQEDVVFTSASLDGHGQWDSDVIPPVFSVIPTNEDLNNGLKSKILIQGISQSQPYQFNFKIFYHKFQKISSSFLDQQRGVLYSTSVDGVLIKFHLNILFSLQESFPIKIFELIQKAGSRSQFKMSSLYNSNPKEMKNPTMQILHIGTTESKFLGIAAYPLTTYEKKNKPWIYHQLALVDTNSEFILSFTDTGSFQVSHDTFLKYGIFWPHQILLLPNPLSETSIRVILTEFLGKIWELRFEKTPQGSWIFDESFIPKTLVQFEGGYPSQTLRGQLSQARYEGKRSSDLYHFEASL